MYLYNGGPDSVHILLLYLAVESGFVNILIGFIFVWHLIFILVFSSHS